jgi:hypothetical protein
MLKKVIIAVILLAGILAAASYFSPHWTVYQMRSAIEQRDYDAFSQYVDYPALRDSFEGQMAAALQEMRNGNSGDTRPLAALTRGIVASLVGPMLDVMITPAGVVEMMNTGTPKITQEVITGAITQTPTAPEAIPDMKVSYRSRDTAAFYRADAPPMPDSFILRRDGLWNWKLAAVELQP